MSGEVPCILSLAKGIIKPAKFEILHDKNRGTRTLKVSIQNTNNIVIPRFRLRFYKGNPSKNLDEAGNEQKGWYNAGPIQPGEWWGARAFPFYLQDGQYEFNVHLDFDNSISEIDENNNRAAMQFKIENGRIVDQSVTCPSNSKR